MTLVGFRAQNHAQQVSVRGAADEVDDRETVVMLIPANRSEQRFWQEFTEPRRDRPGSPLRVEFLRGRLRFLMPGEEQIRPNSRPPFGCCLLVWEALA